MYGDWLVPDWPVPAQVHALCTTRAGGRSMPPYDSLNLGNHVGDAPQAVAANRQILRESMSARPVFLQQVHGVGVLPLNEGTPDDAVADACVASGAGVACTIMVADCLPVLLTDRAGTVVAAAHAGWRGLCHGVVEAACKAMDRPAGDLLAWLGPCIGPEAFEVGGEVREAFLAHEAAAAAHFKPKAGGKWLADLQGLTRQRLEAAGVRQVYGNDGSAPWCTVANPSRFFSHRRDAVALGGSGRMAACIWLA